ncbi:E3 ubiquitin-protein ligase DZIP3 [Exaiptasia diaphana]|nr:E3 ubiquitin-protein ligase DZIP3 [Exaiptasia diaphana]
MTPSFPSLQHHQGMSSESFIVNKIYTQQLWAHSCFSLSFWVMNDQRVYTVIYKEFCSIGIQTDDYGCQNGCSSMYVNKTTTPQQNSDSSENTSQLQNANNPDKDITMEFEDEEEPEQSSMNAISSIMRVIEELESSSSDTLVDNDIVEEDVISNNEAEVQIDDNIPICFMNRVIVSDVLACLLLRNICNLPTPANGWSNEPAATSISQEDDIVRVKLYRNKLSHISERALSDADFNKYWNDIETVLLRLGADMAAIDSLRTQSMDPEDEEYYNECLKEWAKNEERLMQAIHGLEEKMENLLKTSHNRPVRPTSEGIAGVE